MSDPALNIPAEIGAISFMLLALIETHPDRARLLAVFDALTTGVQLYAAQSGGARTPEPMRVAIQRYRSQIDNQGS